MVTLRQAEDKRLSLFKHESVIGAGIGTCATGIATCVRVSTVLGIRRGKTLYNGITISKLLHMDQKILIGMVIGLAVGGVAGFFIGDRTAVSAINAQTEQQVSPQGQAEGAGAAVNAVGAVQTNPYESVKTNPFDY